MPYLPCLSFLKSLCKSKLEIMLILSRPHIFVVTEKGSHSKLLISKRHAYGFGKNSSMLLLSYLSNHWKRTKIKTSFSSRTVLFQGVPQGLVFWSIVSQHFLKFFLLDCNVCNFADDSTPFIFNKTLHFVLISK